MAEVTIDYDATTAADLPPLCMVCGESAEVTRFHTFKWKPPFLWLLIFIGLIGLILYAILSSFLTKTMRVEVPLCLAHRTHWSWRQWATWGGLAVLVIVGVVAAILCDALNVPAPYPGIVALCGFVGFIAWLIMAIILQNTAVRSKLITDDTAKLRGVSGAFAEAHRELEDEREDAYQERRAARRRQQRDETED